jgi:hypothetical protein
MQQCVQNVLKGPSFRVASMLPDSLLTVRRESGDADPIILFSKVYVTCDPRLELAKKLKRKT